MVTAPTTKDTNGTSEVAGAEHGNAADVERHAQGVAKLAGQQAAGDGANGPASFEEAEAARARVQYVVGERDEDHVGADDAGHHGGVGDAERENLRLLASGTRSLL